MVCRWSGRFARMLRTAVLLVFVLASGVVSARAEDPAPIAPPAAPAGLTVQAGPYAGELQLAWAANSEPGVTYTLYRAVGVGEHLALYQSGITATTFTESCLSSNAYYYAVAAVGEDGQSSEMSGVVSGTPGDPTPLFGPLVVNDPGVGRRLDLSWTPGSANQYYIYRSTTSGGPFESLLAVNAPPYTDTGLSDNTTYYYRVVGSGLCGSNSLEGSGTPHDITGPGVPQALTITDPLIGTELRLDWAPGPEGDLAGYNLYRDADPNGSFAAKVNQDGLLRATSVLNKGLTRGQVYYYRVEAVDLTGNSSGASSIVSKSPEDKTPPAAPSLTIADLYTGKDLELSWRANTTDDDLKGYNLYRTSHSAPFTKVNRELLDGSVTHFRDKGLDRDQTYTYYIAAVDQSGNESTPTGADFHDILPVDRTPPAPPVMLGVNDPGNGHLVPSWDSNTEDDLIGYNLYKSGSPSGSFFKVNEGPMWVTRYEDEKASIGVSDWYQVSAVDRYGNESGRSRTAYGRPTDKIPPRLGAGERAMGPVIPGAAMAGLPPGAVSVIDPGTGGSLIVGWSASPDADLAGYNVWFSSSPAGPYLKANPAPLKTTAFTHAGLADGFKVYYRVSAVDTAGNESAQTPDGGASAIPTDRTPPAVVQTTPAGGEPRFIPGKPVTVAFDRAIDSTTITTAILSVTPAGGKQIAPLTATYDPAARRVTFTMPPLLPSTRYVATLTTGVKNDSGVAMASAYTWSFTTGLPTNDSPHGAFMTDPNNCATCHRTHAAAGPEIVMKSNETAVCFYCHNGTQADSNIAGAFADTSGNISRHPVSNTSALKSGLIRCSDCHDPHGNRKPDGTLYPKLLSATDGTTVNHQGNGFCLACHGSTDRKYSGYYGDTAGNHANAGAAHYSETAAALQPPSGTGVTCVQCHEKHAAPVERLLAAVEEKACFACHSNGANSMNGRNIQAEFSQQSYHDISGPPGTKVECSNCHGPHTVARADLAAGGQTSQVSNPANTKEDMAKAAGSASDYVRFTKFCLACHKSQPPTAAATASELVPHTVLFPDRKVTTNAGSGGLVESQRSWDKSAYTSSAHYQAGIGCTECHNSHGSPYLSLKSRTTDSSVTDAQGICGRCHSGNPPIQFGSAKNVFADLTRSGAAPDDRYRHPTLFVGDQHRDTEDYSTVNQTDAGNPRHADCLDCHDPHNDQSYRPVAAPAVTGPLRNVSGVSVDFGAVTWETWNPLLKQPAMTLTNPLQKQYELCLKCHTAFSWGSSPPVPGGLTPDTDVAREFNPNNPSFHAVIGESKIGTFTVDGATYRYGKFTAPVTGDPATRDSSGQQWTATSRMVCEDCHQSKTSGVRGPHGSSEAYILRAPWRRNSGLMGESGTGTGGVTGDLCFKCHSYAFYAGGDPGSATERSAFSGPGDYNLHAEHAGKACTACHVTTVHGWKIRGLLANKSAASDPAIPGSGGDLSAPAPYYDGSKLSIKTWKTPGNWSEEDCGTCHGAE